ncbi:unnamed protein product, partial [Hapterophycus canaliculatus]
IDSGRVEAEIATLELLNQRDTMLCDDLRVACRLGVGTKTHPGSRPSCWALVKGSGVSGRA